jgi:hypothetical protein
MGLGTFEQRANLGHGTPVKIQMTEGFLNLAVKLTPIVNMICAPDMARAE